MGDYKPGALVGTPWAQLEELRRKAAERDRLLAYLERLERAADPKLYPRVYTAIRHVRAILKEWRQGGATT
jgi:hypothetical protein